MSDPSFHPPLDQSLPKLHIQLKRMIFLVEKVDKWLCFPTRSSNQALKMIRDMLIIFANLWLSIFSLHVRTIQCPTSQAGLRAAGSERVPPIFACLKRSLQCGLSKKAHCHLYHSHRPRGIFSKNKQISRRGGLQEATSFPENREAHVKKEEIIEIVQKGRVQEMESSLICTEWLQPAIMLVSYPIKRQLLSQETTYCISWSFCHQNNQKLLSQRHVQNACRIQTSPLNFRLHKYMTFLITTKQWYCIGGAVSQNIIMVLCFPSQH